MQHSQTLIGVHVPLKEELPGYDAYMAQVK